jgi:hypothetical protein
MLNLTSNKVVVLGVIFLLMLMTRGSHFLTELNLPDMSLILFLILGFFIPSLTLFFALFFVGTLIDFGSAVFDVTKGFCLTDGYWGLIPTYAILFYSGYLIKKKNLYQHLNFYVPVLLVAITFAFIVSTNTYYIFSGRFGNPSFFESIMHGWNYYPEYLLTNVVYGLIFFFLLKLKRVSQFISVFKSN